MNAPHQYCTQSITRCCSEKVEYEARSLFNTKRWLPSEHVLLPVCCYAVSFCTAVSQFHRFRGAWRVSRFQEGRNRSSSCTWSPECPGGCCLSRNWSTMSAVLSFALFVLRLGKHHSRRWWCRLAWARTLLDAYKISACVVKACVRLPATPSTAPSAASYACRRAYEVLAGPSKHGRCAESAISSINKSFSMLDPCLEHGNLRLVPALHKPLEHRPSYVLYHTK